LEEEMMIGGRRVVDDHTTWGLLQNEEFRNKYFKLRGGSMGGAGPPKLQASVAAAVLMSSPSIMINFALGSFLTGIGVYLGFVWKHDLDTMAGSLESRNVFVCFILSLVFCYSFYLLPYLSKLSEDFKKSTGNKKEIWKRIR
jgi:hypothetical protein